MLQVDRRARVGAVEIDHVQVFRAFHHPAARRRRAGPRRRPSCVEIALHEPHCAAIENVDRRIEDHTGSRGRAAAQKRVKFPSSRSPWARTSPGATACRTCFRAPRSRGRARHSRPCPAPRPSSAGHGAKLCTWYRKAGSGKPSLSGGAAASAARSSRCAAASIPARSSRAPPRATAQARRAAVLRRALEQQLHPHAQPQQRHARARALAEAARRVPPRESPPSPPGMRPRREARSPSIAAQPVGSRLTYTRAPTCSSAFSTERRLPIP